MCHKTLVGFIRPKKKIYAFVIKRMYNQFTEYKKLLQTFSFQEQIVDDIIKKLTNKKQIANIKDNRYKRIEELKHIRYNLKIKTYR